MKEYGSSEFKSTGFVRSMLQDIAEVYLAHLYDFKIKSKIMESIINDVYNPMALKHDQG